MNVYDDKKIIRKPLSEISVNQVIIVKKGEIIPLDGEIDYGHSEVDESIISGEAEPILKKQGDTVVSGSVNLGNDIEVKVTKKDGETTINYIEKLILKAQTTKPDVQELVNKITNIFVPSILILSLSLIHI